MNDGWEPVCDRCPERGEEPDIVEIFYGVVEGPLPPQVIFGGWPINGLNPTHYCRRCGSHLLDPAGRDGRHVLQHPSGELTDPRAS